MLSKQNGFINQLYTFSQGFIRIFSLALMSLLFLGGMLFTCYSTDMATQIVLTRWDNPLWNLLWIAVFFLFLALPAGFICKNHDNPKKRPPLDTVLTVIILFWCLAVGGVLILFGRTVPASVSVPAGGLRTALPFGNG